MAKVGEESPVFEIALCLEARDRRNRQLELFCLSFLALFLELMIIRWAPSVVRLVAYYANLMLISSFLGMGLGAMISRRRESLFRWMPSLLAISIGFLLFAQRVTLPGTLSEYRFYAQGAKLANYLILIVIFLTNAAVFVPLGQRIGALFESLPPLRAYSWDLGGSLAGTLVFGLFSLKHFSPALGIVVVAGLQLAFSPRKQWILAVPTLGLVAWGVIYANDSNAFWSPYYYVLVREAQPSTTRFIGNPGPTVREPVAHLRVMLDPPTYSVSVNHDFYQPDGTINPERYSPARRAAMVQNRAAYDLPYLLSPQHHRVLVLGAGGGTDTEIAVLNGADVVDAVEIDPMLVNLSRKFNASGIYDDPRVQVHVDDARAFLRRATASYDMIVFGFLDSQALFSSMSNLRLDGYIYTVQSMRSAYRLLNDHGTLSLSFVAGREWLVRKLVRMLQDATGKTPLVYENRSGQVILCVPKGEITQAPSVHDGFVRTEMTSQPAMSEPPTDEWPFLYLNGRGIPRDYLVVIVVLLVVSTIMIYLIRGRGLTVGDSHFLFLGFGFLLLETKSISDCSLYFGTTWFVTMLVVSGVLIMVLAANLVAMHMKFHFLMYVPLIASLLLVGLVKKDTVLSLSLAERLGWSLFVVSLPIFFAGLIFSTTFRAVNAPALAFGANLIGAMAGGFCEYLSMLIGNDRLIFIIVAAYGASLLSRLKSKYA